MQSQNAINLFNQFNQELSDQDIIVINSGTTDGGVIVTNAQEYFDNDELAAEAAFSDLLESEGVSFQMTLEDALNGNFPPPKVEVDISLSITTDSQSVQDGNALKTIKALFQKALEKIEEIEEYDEERNYFTYEQDIKLTDANSKEIGQLSIDIDNDD